MQSKKNLRYLGLCPNWEGGGGLPDPQLFYIMKLGLISQGGGGKEKYPTFCEEIYMLLKQISPMKSSW